ncbi:MAG: cytochrome c3 family protein [Desulfuromonadales bacterium]|nr:cytochrome c3 family protein [Desulfuromonadales bacterium]
MTSRWLLILFLLLITPAFVYARWIEDKVMMPVEATGPVEFSHNLHFETKDVGRNCPSCHNDVFNIVVSKNPVFTMSDMADGKSCGVCHNGTRAFAVDGDCTTCHKTRDIAMQVAATGIVMFSHEVHLGMFGCTECHPDLFKPQQGANTTTMKAMEGGASCGACHDGSTAFGVKSDCTTCHPTRDITFNVAATGPVGFSHDIHTGMYGCGACHPKVFIPQAGQNTKTMKQMNKGASCGACHDGSTAFGVKSDCTTCHPTRNMTFNVAATGPVGFSHDVHTGMYGCGECHPGLFVPKAGMNTKTMAQMNDGESCGACHDGSTAFGVESDCTSCHPTKEIVFPVKATGPVTFSHDVHTGMYGCGDCHTGLFLPQEGKNPASMSDMEGGASCGACHDGDTAFAVKTDCTSCHPTRDVTFPEDSTGNVTFSHDVHTGMYSCSECHPDLFVPQAGENIVGMDAMGNGKSCGACHDGNTAFSVAEACDSCHQM